MLRARKELDDAGLDNGPQSISWRLESLGFDPFPSRATVYRILVDHGQIVAQPRKRPKTRRRFEYADPGGLWQIDGNRKAVLHWRGDDVTVLVGDVIARELTLNRSVKFQPLTALSTKS
ncbi:hypothetical protein P3H15_28015 [Rhodococcus sp. T2V]|uniref:hypothetical protein n=1 Tax=Rhodococcus sp. T2V TaxID=3034164 RepID=UPI0023E32A6B|nr:hypothetical protein [Rhodococcus sp. T2V]MDF3308868.1 hypothetical protein [Rhodococcus sp. T2V]